MLIREVEQFLQRNDMPATTFGRRAMRDPRFVGDLRDGREPRPATAAKVRKWMEENDGTDS